MTPCPEGGYTLCTPCLPPILHPVHTLGTHQDQDQDQDLRPKQNREAYSKRKPRNGLGEGVSFNFSANRKQRWARHLDLRQAFHPNAQAQFCVLDGH